MLIPTNEGLCGAIRERFVKNLQSLVSELRGRTGLVYTRHIFHTDDCMNSFNLALKK